MSGDDEQRRRQAGGWTIHLFSGLAAVWGGEGDDARRITRFSTQKTGALLAYLAYHRARAHPREVLIETFWPGDNLQAGRHSLSMALSSLRHQLEPPGVPAGAVIVADRQNVGLNAQAVTTDVAAFERALDLAARATSKTEQAERLAEAVEGLYAGSLLPGYYEEWVLAEQGRLEMRLIEAAAALAGLREQAGDLPGAIAAARRAVEADPVREEGQTALVSLLARAGRHAEALRQFREWERLLEQETGETPSSGARALARRVEAQAGSEATATPLAPVAPAAPRTAPRPAPAAAAAAALLPTGTVTFLLTDIEGSTVYEERTGETLGDARERHHALLRRAFRAHGGHEVKETGDGFLVAFARPSDALASALDGQRALAAEAWPATGPPLLARMALHTGEAEVGNEGDYQGPVPHRAARLLAAAHGGQVLCSEATAGLLRRDLAPGTARLTDLGVFRLRDLPAPERLFQVDPSAAPPGAFPPPRAEAAYQANLPLTFTRFFGREREIEQLVTLLGDPVTRLVTLTGPGGTGKTRLSLRVAERLLGDFGGLVCFVGLAEVTNARRVVEAVAGALRLPPDPHQTPLAQIATHLGERRALLVLDNFEQVAGEGAPLVHALLARVPGLTCLVTSRQLLNLDAEREFALGPLPAPAPSVATPDQLRLFESVQLFVDRAQAVRPDFQITPANAPALAALCERLEGLPLALELAASRAQVLTPAQMVAQLDDRFAFLVSRRADKAARHRSLFAAVEWSFRLLAPELARFFTALSIFRGGWSLEAAEAVADDPLALDHLAQLRECSLILTDEAPDGAMRFRMLETLREYAQAQRTPNERADLTRRHAAYFAEFAENVQPNVAAPQQAAAFARLETEHDNLRVALSACQTAPPDDADADETGLRLARTLWRFWEVRGYFAEGRERIAAVLARPGTLAEKHDAPRARVWAAAGTLAYRQCDYDIARAHFQESRVLAERIGEKAVLALSLNGLGFVAAEQGDLAGSRDCYEASLAVARELGDGRLISVGLNNLASIAHRQKDYATARALYEQSLAVKRQAGDLRGQGVSLNNLAVVALNQADFVGARAYLREALPLRHGIGDQSGCAAVLENFARLAAREGQAARAARLYGAAEALREQIGAPAPPNERLADDDDLRPARDALGAAGFEAARAEGRDLPLDQACRYALDDG